MYASKHALKTEIGATPKTHMAGTMRAHTHTDTHTHTQTHTHSLTPPPPRSLSHCLHTHAPTHPPTHPLINTPTHPHKTKNHGAVTAKIQLRGDGKSDSEFARVWQAKTGREKTNRNRQNRRRQGLMASSSTVRVQSVPNTMSTAQGSACESVSALQKQTD